MESLVNNLISQGYLKTPHVIRAFRKIDRADFVLPEFSNSAAANVPLPIGHGQTISQPLTVAFMLELLQPEAGDKILDVGSGSGWTTALLAEIVGKRGQVFSMEIVPELCKFGKENTKKYFAVLSSSGDSKPHGSEEARGSKRKGVDSPVKSRDGRGVEVRYLCVDGSRGYLREAPYDKILVSAAAEKLPRELKNQLKINGRLVIPIQNSIWLIEQTAKNKFREEEHYGFTFVPLVGKPASS